MDFILLVDDSKVARMLLKKGVATAIPGVEIVEAIHAEDAILKLEGKEDANALAIIDYNMPGMTGLELAVWLEEHCPGMKRVLCTANIQDSLIQRANEIDVPVLPKPFSVQKLRDVLALPAA